MSRSTKAQNSMRLTAIGALYDAGFSRGEISLAFGLSQPRVSAMLCQVNRGVDYANKERDEQIISAYKGGKTLEQIGVDLSLTRERVRQILSKNGVTRNDRGLTRQEADKVEALSAAMKARIASIENKTRVFYGCSCDELSRINGNAPRSRVGSPAQIYTQQRKNAQFRGIEWTLSLPVWFSIWEESGRWADRGRGKGKFCMARHGDQGPYAKENVYIATNEENISDGYLVTNASERRAKACYRTIPASQFTKKQQEILPLVERGMNYQEIAAELHMNPKSAWQYVRAINTKLSKSVTAQN